MLLLLSQSLLTAKGPSSSMQGRDKKSRVSHPRTQARGRGLHLEGCGIPMEGTSSGLGGRDQRDSLSNLQFPVCPRRGAGLSHPRK